MKRFFNMIPGEDAACILLYGDIGDYDKVRSGDVVRELLEMEAQYKKIDVRINSNGGDVYSGIAIFNAFKNTKADITIYIDGIAASIASGIALCGKPLYMSRYSRLMLHSIQGGAYGNKKELAEVIEQIDSLENTLAEMLATRCKKTVDEIKAEYFDGADHWLTAEQAMAAGLIDGIYDTEETVPADSTPDQVYTIFNNRLKQPQNDNQMNFDELRKRPAFQNCTTDDDVLRQITHLETEAGKVTGLTAEVTSLKGKLKVFEDKAAADEEAAIDGLIQTAFEEGRITEPQKVTYKAILKADRENGEAALKALPVKRRVMNNLHTSSGEGKGAWEKRMEEIEQNLKK
ncbi:head maturation protease, ClpP-related [uncultured Bacteroides sp.]|uniref:head maturation protease, ClpP-related n=1 Tax=uncultured Bacteroides sp. TaxID=162156 RepID=UPI000820DD99|nr:head maturation protease, ClpP-related [uncultured Bacteroides sp.]SCI88525.1 ATP-dependent Clp protease proteolytic subunit 2 [uncultured Bacteroides sp.]